MVDNVITAAYKYIIVDRDIGNRRKFSEIVDTFHKGVSSLTRRSIKLL